MKNIKWLFAVPPVVFLILLFTGAGTSSCNKTRLHDTVTFVKKDTIIRIDTVVKVDTIYGVNCGLIAYYNFNGGSLKDSSGLGNDIAFSNATPAPDRFGRPGNAYAFNGNSSYMRVANSASLNLNTSITIFAVVKVAGFYTGNCHQNQIIGKGSPDWANGFYAMRFDDTLGQCSAAPDINNEYFGARFGDNSNPYGAASGAYDRSTPIVPGTWYKVAYTYDGHTARIYINGILKSSASKDITFANNTQDLFIGKTENPSFPFWFNGVIDEIRIYNKPLSQCAINQLNNLQN